ncbi:Hypothetical protein CINCED_3A008913 [Cinara cedri]|uniref:Uncharacterized protein n=1 Tax=Cinara cedri TaxID=506608 RepID=A0A5E4M7Z3_9HEMI|nr:Hypothetical protein CINCED_3A008913 [Cinara cedri]
MFNQFTVFGILTVISLTAVVSTYGQPIGTESNNDGNTDLIHHTDNKFGSVKTDTVESPSTADETDLTLDTVENHNGGDDDTADSTEENKNTNSSMLTNDNNNNVTTEPDSHRESSDDNSTEDTMLQPNENLSSTSGDSVQ